MITLGLDLSSKSTGYSIYDGKELKKYGCIVASDTNLFNRINKMINELEVILNENKIDQVMIEDVLIEDVHHNHTVFKALTYLQGFVLNLMNNYKITKVEFCTASQWRKKCGIKTGKGIKREELKAEDIKFVKEKFNIDVNDDVADAIGIGWFKVGQ